MLFILVYLILVSGLILVAMFEPGKKHYVPYKMLCSALFVILGLYYDMSLSIAGLALCFGGDLFMGLYNIHRKKKFIGLGIFLFLLAHIVFLVYLFTLYPDFDYIQVIIPLLMCLLVLVLIGFCHLHLGKLRYAVLIYSFFVSAFMVKAVHIMISGIMQNRLQLTASTSYADISDVVQIGIAGILFWLSDFSLLFYYFYHFKSKNIEKLIQGFNLATYYVAMMLLAML